MKISSILSYSAATALAALIASLAAAEFTTATYVLFTVSMLAMIITREYTPRRHFVVTNLPARSRTSWTSLGARSTRSRRAGSFVLAR